VKCIKKRTTSPSTFIPNKIKLNSLHNHYRNLVNSIVSWYRRNQERIKKYPSNEGRKDLNFKEIKEILNDSTVSWTRATFEVTISNKGIKPEKGSPYHKEFQNSLNFVSTTNFKWDRFQDNKLWHLKSANLLRTLGLESRPKKIVNIETNVNDSTNINWNFDMRKCVCNRCSFRFIFFL
jgi:hypothetical protein